MDRRSLLDDDATSLRERSDVFGDEYEVEDYDVVADGFRPQNDADGEGSIHDHDQTYHEPIRTISAHYASSAPIPPPMRSPAPSRNSTRKSRGERNPFSSPDDDETSPLDPRHSLQFEPDEDTLRRSASSASSRIFAQTHSPRFGAAGPSHPYAMYPQGTVARTPSTATTSTMRAPRSSSVPHNGPQHPYAMYPQGVEEDLEDEDDVIRQNPVPIGFSGQGSNFIRRMGPDGEEQDIIGDYGHTEQLPPYTRYPDEGPEKMPLLMPTALHSRAPVAGTDPTMPLMHTVIQPENAPQSMTDDSQLNRQSTASLARVPSSSSAESQPKSWREMTWRQRRKERVCGVPCWIIAAIVAVLVFILAVITGIVAGYFAGKNGNSSTPTVTVITSPVDASIIPSPTGQAPPPTGTFALSLSAPMDTQDACLPQASQQPAWDCDLVPNQDLAVVLTQNSFGNATGASIFYASNDRRIFYGAQVWNLNTPYAEFLTVADKDDPDNGPAFYFQQFYDKIVVLPEDTFDPATKKAKRDADWDHRLWSQRQTGGLPLAGDKPWFCVFNETFLEGFIYVQKPKASSTPISTSAPSTTSTGVSTSFGRPTSWPTPGATYTTTITDSQTTATSTGIQSGFAAWSSAVQAHQSSATDDSSHAKRQINPDQSLWSQLPQMPYLIKLEERRTGNQSVQPYCQQYQILDTMAANWVADKNGEPIIIPLDEVDPTMQQYMAGSRKRDVVNSCHCQWMVGQS